MRTTTLLDSSLCDRYSFFLLALSSGRHTEEGSVGGAGQVGGGVCFTRQRKSLLIEGGLTEAYWRSHINFFTEKGRIFRSRVDPLDPDFHDPDRAHRLI